MNWNNINVYPRTKLNAAIAFSLRNMKGYLPLYKSERTKLLQYGARNMIDDETMISIRRHTQIQSVVYKRVSSDIGKSIVKAFDMLVKDVEGEKDDKVIVDLFLKFLLSQDVPIVHIDRALKKYDISEVNPKLIGYLKEFLEKMRGEDNKVREDAESHEKALCEFLLKSNLVFETEADLKAKGESLTPDVLLKEAVTITVGDTTHQVRWIDAKNYSLAPHKFFLSKLTKQAAKYIKAFGPGAFVFNHSIDDSFRLENVIMLDGSALYL